MSPERQHKTHRPIGFPRVSGDEPTMDGVLPSSE